jgi:hypothetical protein
MASREATMAGVRLAAAAAAAGRAASVSDSDEGAQVRRGKVKKKDEGGVRGFRMWRERYMKFLPGNHTPGEEEAAAAAAAAAATHCSLAAAYQRAPRADGVMDFLALFVVEEDGPAREPELKLPLLQISKVEYLPEKKDGGRFDVTHADGVLSLGAESIQDAKEWVRAISLAIHARRAANNENVDTKKKPVSAAVSPLHRPPARARRADSPLPAKAARFTPLQQVFFRLVWERDIHEEPDVGVDAAAAAAAAIKGATKVLPTMQRTGAAARASVSACARAVGADVVRWRPMAAPQLRVQRSSRLCKRCGATSPTTPAFSSALAAACSSQLRPHAASAPLARRAAQVPACVRDDADRPVAGDGRREGHARAQRRPQARRVWQATGGQSPHSRASARRVQPPAR